MSAFNNNIKMWGEKRTMISPESMWVASFIIQDTC